MFKLAVIQYLLDVQSSIWWKMGTQNALERHWHMPLIWKSWYFVTQIVLTYCGKNCSSDQEKLLKFKAEGQEFAKFLRSLEQFIQTVKGQNNFW